MWLTPSPPGGSGRGVGTEPLGVAMLGVNCHWRISIAIIPSRQHKLCHLNQLSHNHTRKENFASSTTTAGATSAITEGDRMHLRGRGTLVGKRVNQPVFSVREPGEG